ncbi:hypothetical protein KQI86_19945 [Clostridium sp. MSJ-11]|uniref:Uncharacterized protein n=1 Tax=Clostridium mobile TaxID=2841512 RepID=A0ABS6EMU0_9CLOT|nr:hypothetical protein [Clostridium mobile]MBU5486557.1 hypothetical protein [Clostridium mobile]
MLIVALNFQVNNNIIYNYNNSTSSIVEIDINKLEKKDEATVKTINLVNEEIYDKDIFKIVIIYNNEKILDNKSFKAIYNYFNIYKKERDILLLKETSDIENSKIGIITKYETSSIIETIENSDPDEFVY